MHLDRRQQKSLPMPVAMMPSFRVYGCVRHAAPVVILQQSARTHQRCCSITWRPLSSSSKSCFELRVLARQGVCCRHAAEECSHARACKDGGVALQVLLQQILPCQMPALGTALSRRFAADRAVLSCIKAQQTSSVWRKQLPESSKCTCSAESG